MEIYAIHIDTIWFSQLTGCYSNVEDVSTLKKVFTTEAKAEEYGRQVLAERASKLPDATRKGDHVFEYFEDGVAKTIRMEVVCHELAD